MHAVRAVRAARSYGSACEHGLAWDQRDLRSSKKNVSGKEPKPGANPGPGLPGLGLQRTKGELLK